MKTALLIVGHGSRDAAGNAEFEALVQGYREARPELEVAHGYVELATPTLQAALSALARRAEHVVVLPLFLFAAGHVKNDLPLALEQARREFPAVRFSALSALGVHPTLVDIALQRARSAHGTVRSQRGAAGAEATKSALIVVGRGSSDPDANGDFCKLARLLAESQDFGWVLPCFIGIASPLFEAAIELVARSRPAHVVVLPYFLFTGRLLSKLHAQVEAFRERYPWIRVSVAAPLAPDARLTSIFDERLVGLLAERSRANSETTAPDHALVRPLPCDNCQYRLPVAGIARNVGGLRALLFSLRHAYTHTQAMPHQHAHRPLVKHVLVCANADCAERGSVPLLGKLRRLVREAGQDLNIRVTRTHCLGRCGEGPTVAVYPDGIWYRGVQESDAAELVQEHLLRDRLVSRLVDNIMQ